MRTQVVECGATHGCEAKGMNLYTQRGHIFLLEFASQMALDEGGLTRSVGDTNTMLSGNPAEEGLIVGGAQV